MQNKYYKNHVVKKKWGQIFLNDPNVINDIINFINPQKHQTIIEIGPGLGALTQPILNIIDFLIVIECDSQLSHKLLHIFGKKKLKIFNQDVMTVNFFHLSNQFKQKLRLVGNLPYNISTKLIIYLFQYINIIYDMHFMLQKEVGNRIIAQPNNKDYGRLSILTQYYCKVFPLLKISNISFVPIPKVESIMIKFVPYHNNSAYPIVDIKLLSTITQAAFHQRRKIIRNSLSCFFSAIEIEKIGVNANIRAENLTIKQFCMLTKLLYNKYYKYNES